ncbi:MAG TPA: hypothetical protein G4O14_04130 [Anaerolineae bacterium]|nr:hypothetical protein [Anaerolineae bacterium]
MHCPHCGQIHAGDASFCPETGKLVGRERIGHISWMVLALSVLCVLVLSISFAKGIDTSGSLSVAKPISPVPISSNAVAESLQQALHSVHRFKVNIDANYLEPTGNKVRILSGMAQFETQEQDAETLSYLMFNIEGEIESDKSIEIYIKSDKVSLSGLWLDDQWLTMTSSLLESQPGAQGSSSVSMEHPYSLLASLAGISGLEAGDFYPVMGLPFSGEHLNETWETEGETTLDGQPYFLYSYRSEDKEIWNRILPTILTDTGIIEKVSSELWVETTDYLPHLIRHTLDLDMGPVLGAFQIEINIHPYDFNLPLDLPSDLPF